jgi:F-type H+-transporting ATPase subunit delta
MTTDPHAIPQHEKTADVGAQRIARVYAEALHAAAQKQGQADDILGELESLVNDVLSRDERLRILFGAAVGRDIRHEAIAKAFEGRASGVLTSFLQVLNSHERLELVRPIARAYRELADEKARRVRIFVTTAVPLPDDQRHKLADELRQRMQMEPVILAEVDPSLLGGMRLRVGDRQYDATVKNRIEQLRTQILARSSHEIQSRRDRFRTAVGDRAV